MIDRLRQIEASYDAVVAEMSTQEAASDPARLQALGRELARLQPTDANAQVNANRMSVLTTVSPIDIRRVIAPAPAS